jgi:hypothetical protein
MQRSKGLIMALIAAFVLLSSTACLAIFPTPDFPPTGIGYLDYQLRLGWSNNTQAWYLNFDASTNDVSTARRGAPFFWVSSKLSSALVSRGGGQPIGAQPMYIVLNPTAAQGPVFSTVPGQALYSGLWQVFYVTWKPGAAKRPITNSNPSPDPQGLPSASDADITSTRIVIQYPIAAVGRLGGPWSPAPPGTYRIAQAVVDQDYTATKRIFLPTFTVFCQNFITKAVTKEIVTIPDVSDQDLADQIGANPAPGLLNVPDSDTQAFWSINSSPYLGQFPVLEQCPSGAGDKQGNTDWTPIVRLTYLDRTGVAPGVVINNKLLISSLILSGRLTVASDDHRMGILFVNKAALVTQ